MRKIICSTEKDNFGDGGICAICRRRSDGIGEYRRRPESIVWACRDHFDQVKKAAYMSTKEFDYNECRQLEATAEAYGKHLDDIGIVMMKKNGEPVSWEEWVSITSFPLDHFGGGLAKRVSSHEAPF